MQELVDDTLRRKFLLPGHEPDHRRGGLLPVVAVHAREFYSLRPYQFGKTLTATTVRPAAAVR